MKKKKFYVFYSYTTGGVWYYIYAYSKEAIEKVFPEMYIFEKPPKRFEPRDAEVIEKYPESYIYDIDNLHGLLKDYVDNEQKDNYNYQHPDKKGPFVDDP
jgi:hypothetical protein